MGMVLDFSKLDFSKPDETIKNQQHYQQKLIDAFNLAQPSGLTWRQLLCSSGVLKNKFVNGYVDSLIDPDQKNNCRRFLSEPVTEDNLKDFLRRLNPNFSDDIIISEENKRRAQILKLIDSYHQKKDFLEALLVVFTAVCSAPREDRRQSPALRANYQISILSRKYNSKRLRN